jgi:hypothetical protein
MKATHVVGTGFTTYGVDYGPGALVDASAWPNVPILVDQGYLKPLEEAATPGRMPEAAPQESIAEDLEETTSDPVSAEPPIAEDAPSKPARKPAPAATRSEPG